MKVEVKNKTTPTPMPTITAIVIFPEKAHPPLSGIGLAAEDVLTARR